MIEYARRDVNVLGVVQVAVVLEGVVSADLHLCGRRGHARLERCGLREAVQAASGRLAKTFPARWPVLPLDRIYLRNARAVEPRVLSAHPWSHLSDHAPLFSGIRLETGNGR